MALVLSVAVSPASATVAGGGQQQFSALVSGTGVTQLVTWTATAGSITTGGLYTAPAAGALPKAVVITAISTDDPSKTGAGSVIVPSSSGSMGVFKGRRVRGGLR